MIKPVPTTLSFTFVACFSLAASAAEQGPMLNLGATPMAMAASCPAQLEIERGWEAQQRLIDERLAAKGQAVEIPGTIISPPLPDFGSAREGSAATASVTRGRAVFKSRSANRNRM